MKLDDMLERKLEALARLSGKSPDEIVGALLADICPECGQKLPGSPGALDSLERTSKAAKIIEYLSTDSLRGRFGRAADAVGCTRSYVTTVWKDHLARRKWGAP